MKGADDYVGMVKRKYRNDSYQPFSSGSRNHSDRSDAKGQKEGRIRLRRQLRALPHEGLLP